MLDARRGEGTRQLGANRPVSIPGQKNRLDRDAPTHHQRTATQTRIHRTHLAPSIPRLARGKQLQTWLACASRRIDNSVTRCI